MDSGFDQSLRIANRKHDVVTLCIKDKRESTLPNIGLAQFKDLESGKSKWLDTSSKRVREQYSKQATLRDLKLKDTFKRAGVDSTEVYTDQDYVRPLMTLFKHRG